MDAWIIRRGGFSGIRKYWAGFKGDKLNRNPRAKARSRWSTKLEDAVLFVRERDAKEIIAGLRLYRLSPNAARITGAEP